MAKVILNRRAFVAGLIAAASCSQREAKAWVYGNSNSAIIDLYRDFSITGLSSQDLSVTMQAALNAAAASGGNAGAVIFAPPGVIRCKGLSLPSRVRIVGAGRDATKLMLPNNANTFLLASASYVTNSVLADQYGGLLDITLDGNKANNASGDLLISRSWRADYGRVAFINAPRHAILCSDPSANATPLNNGQHIADVNIHGCQFQACNGAAYYGANGANQGLADNNIIDCTIGSCGLAGQFYAIESERSAGFRIINNQFFNNGPGELKLLICGGTKIALNDFDSTADTVPSGVKKIVYLQVPTGGTNYGTLAVQNNMWRDNSATLGSASAETLVEINAARNNGIIVTGNNFWSETVDVTALVYSGSVVGSVQLYAPGNSYSAHAPKPTDPNINTTG